MADLAACLIPLALAMTMAVGSAFAADITPYRAIYSLTLASTKPSSGVVGASGAMLDEWGDTCDGRTEQEHSKLRLEYVDQDSVDITSSLVTWESKDGRRYRFNQRTTRNGQLDDETKGEAALEAPGKGGTAEFTKPEAATLTLAPGVLFPMAHTIRLIDGAQAGQQFISVHVFDGGTLENASQITAVIGPRLAPGATDGEAKGIRDPLLDHPSWRVRLAVFPAGGDAEEPDYEETIRLFENGIMQDMILDYGDYVIHAKLDEIAPLPKPSC